MDGITQAPGSIAMGIANRCLHFILLSLLVPSQALTSLPSFSASITQPNSISSKARTPQLPFHTASSPQATVTLQLPGTTLNPPDTSELSVQTDFAAMPSRTVEVISPTVSLASSAPSVTAHLSMSATILMSWLSANSAHVSRTHASPPTTPPPFPISTHPPYLPTPVLTTSVHVSSPPPTTILLPTTDIGGTVSSPSQGATIAVAAVGAVLLVAVLIALLVCCWCCCRHRRKYEYSTGEYRVTVQTWNATNPAHYTVTKSESFNSRSSIRSSFGLKPKVLRHKNQTNVLGVYSTPL